MVENDKKGLNNNSKPDDATKKSPKSPFGDKIIIDTVGARSGTCVFHNFLYALLFLFGGLYFAYICDKPTFKQYSDSYPYLGYLENAFVAIEDYSPFHQFMQSDEEFFASLKRTVPEGEPEPENKDDLSASTLKIFTKSELSLYSGEEGSPGLYLAFLGKVYDVSKGKDYYGPGGGYAFFSGKDGSRAFVSGQFDEAGLIDDVSGLPHSDYLGLAEWQQFYDNDYTLVGVLQGRFYDEKGEVTQQWKQVQESIVSAEKDKDRKDVEKKMFPPCNMEWNADKGTRFWCTKKSGGVQRNWVGVPRRLFYPGRDERCACIRTSGPPSIDQASKENRGDIDNPHLKEYEGCELESFECWKST